MTHQTDKELDALDAKLASQIGDDVAVIFNHEYLFKQLRIAITTLRTQLADARSELSYTNKRLEHAFERIERQARTIDDLTVRTNRAEAALAAQIEADALVCDELAAACAMALALAANDTPEVRTAVAYSIKIAKRCAATIRAQPHDRTALDRMLAEHEVRLREAREISEAEKIAIREKALREAADMFDADSNIAQTILALIEADHAKT